MATLLIIADDFTGALDTGVQFAAEGAITRVVTNSGYDLRRLDPTVQVLVMDAETRHLSSSAAYEIVYDITDRAIKHGIPYIYKKTDSALRGNIGSELAAVLHASKAERLSFFPSLPKMGRCTKNGTLYIDGLPVEESVFGRDPFEHVTCSHVPQLIKQQTNANVFVRSLPISESSSKPPPGITVWDSETEEDLMEAGVFLKSKGCLGITAGCAGFAAVLSKLLGFSGRLPPLPAFSPSFLVICGSLNPITSRQLDAAEENGFLRIRLTPEQKLDSSFWLRPEGKSLLQQWAELLKQYPRTILDSSDFPGQALTQQYAADHSLGLSEIRTRISDSYGRILKALMELGLKSTLMITGGDTLLGCMKRLGVHEMEPLCELEPGTVLSSFTLNHQKCQVISKSGGFGSKDLLSRLAQRISADTPVKKQLKEEAVC